MHKVAVGVAIMCAVLGETLKFNMVTVWGAPVDSLFQHVLKFYRQEKEHIRLEYSQRVQLLALFKQVKLGSYSSDKDTGTGYFDMVGADRRRAWKNLGDMSEADAQTGIIQILEGVCPRLKEVVLNEVGRQQDQHCIKEDTSGQIVPGENGLEDEVDTGNSRTDVSPPLSPPSPEVLHTALAPAALWCSPKSAANFIAQLRSSFPADSASGGPLTLSPGETVAVQVPTSVQASAIFWEFATAYGDIGFGVNFQWREGEASNPHSKHSERLLPVTVRNCSEDLVLGSHQYQEQGTYTLDFVNSHSTLPKTIYYKVFYQATMQINK